MWRLRCCVAVKKLKRQTNREGGGRGKVENDMLRCGDELRRLINARCEGVECRRRMKGRNEGE